MIAVDSAPLADPAAPSRLLLGEDEVWGSDGGSGAVSELDPVGAQEWLHALLGAAPVDVADARGYSDAALLRVMESLAAQAAVIAARQATVAGEVARRSRPELGFGGLAQSRGHRTSAELVRVATGSSLRDARAAVEIGTLLIEAAAPTVDPGTGEVAEPVEPWLAGVVAAVAGGLLAPGKAAAIRRGLGSPGEGLDADALLAAAERLLVEAAQLDADRLLVRARELRDELDVVGVAERSRRLRAQRSFRVFTQSDGSTIGRWVMDPETAAIVTEIVDRATSPKLGGPRFVDAGDAARAAAIAADPRTPEQVASDTVLDLLRAGHAADPDLLLGAGAPAVRVLVTATDLAAGTGVGAIEGQTVPIAMTEVDRHVCAHGTQFLVIAPDGRPLDLGRTTRLFSAKQRTALAARDGGCRFPGCDRPPGWAEAHHVRWWERDHGLTDIDNGILLCRHHHLLVHDCGWQIRLGRAPDGTPGIPGVDWEILPPASIDPTRTPIPMPTRSPTYRRLLTE